MPHSYNSVAATMSVDHVVLFKWKDDAPAETIQEFARAVVALKDKVPGILDLSFGEDFSKTSRAQGFTHMLIVRMENKDTVPFYDAHPEHQKVVALIRPIMDKNISLNIESPRHMPIHNA
ncbi:Aste57867_21548 [Aphanomyces stellatus]|uniref:Aste57867_21548 protein n=1 Tax=Aphanomyces stellatus TaxID=120398 RepID=A0A485LHU4_9STRA|nr:hypothetical protein As57867_021479 [Aphanomyces stellatus]VFT98218.1 Aste57867_21548 [Aphanomyces stellatus]